MYPIAKNLKTTKPRKINPIIFFFSMANTIRIVNKLINVTKKMRICIL